MKGQNASSDDGCQTEVIKDVTTVTPHISVPILANALVVEPVYLSDLSTFVISSDQGNPIWVSHLQGQQEQKSFNAIKASIHKVAKEEIIGLGTFTSHPEELSEVIKLSMDISTYLKK